MRLRKFLWHILIHLNFQSLYPKAFIWVFYYEKLKFHLHKSFQVRNQVIYFEDLKNTPGYPPECFVNVSWMFMWVQGQLDNYLYSNTWLFREIFRIFYSRGGEKWFSTNLCDGAELISIQTSSRDVSEGCSSKGDLTIWLAGGHKQLKLTRQCPRYCSTLFEIKTIFPRHVIVRRNVSRSFIRPSVDLGLMR